MLEQFIPVESCLTLFQQFSQEVPFSKVYESISILTNIQVNTENQ